MGLQNLTPEQRAMPRCVQATAYKRLPTTCDKLSSILEQLGRDLQAAFNIPEEDYAGIDRLTRQAFQAIRDEVTQPFRTEQMRLLKELQDGKMVGKDTPD